MVGGKRQVHQQKQLQYVDNQGKKMRKRNKLGKGKLLAKSCRLKIEKKFHEREKRREMMSVQGEKEREKI